VTGVDPSEGFLKAAAENLAGRATFQQGNATSLPLSDASVDVVVSGLVLNFVPDARAALAEMVRVTSKEGTIAAYVWDYGGRMDLMRFFWDAAVEMDPAAEQKNESVRFGMCTPDALASLFTAAGLKSVETRAIDVPTPFASFEEYWQPFLGGQGPAPAYAMSLDEAARGRLRDRLRAKVPATANGSISMIARAWAVRGHVPG
jgi:SAM-dependent methyltransferase